RRCAREGRLVGLPVAGGPTNVGTAPRGSLRRRAAPRTHVQEPARAPAPASCTLEPGPPAVVGRWIEPDARAPSVADHRARRRAAQPPAAPRASRAPLDRA